MNDMPLYYCCQVLISCKLSLYPPPFIFILGEVALHWLKFEKLLMFSDIRLFRECDHGVCEHTCHQGQHMYRDYECSCNEGYELVDKHNCESNHTILLQNRITLSTYCSHCNQIVIINHIFHKRIYSNVSIFQYKIF